MEQDNYDAKILFLLSFCICPVFLSNISFIESIVYSSIQNIVFPFLITTSILRSDAFTSIKKNVMSIFILALLFGLIPSIISSAFSGINYFFLGGNLRVAQILSQPVFTFTFRNWINQVDISVLINLVMGILSGLSGLFAYFFVRLFSKRK
jgi:hypothetical protein